MNSKRGFVFLLALVFTILVVSGVLAECTFTEIEHFNQGSSDVKIFQYGSNIYTLNQFSSSSDLRAFSWDGSTAVANGVFGFIGAGSGIFKQGNYLFVTTSSTNQELMAFEFGTSLSSQSPFSKSLSFTPKAIWGDGEFIYVLGPNGIYAYTFEGEEFTLVNSKSLENTRDMWGKGNYIYVAQGEDGITALNFDGVSFQEIANKAISQSGIESAEKIWVDPLTGKIYSFIEFDGLRVYAFDGTTFDNVGFLPESVYSIQDIWSNGDNVFLAYGDQGTKAYVFDGTSFLTGGTQLESLSGTSSRGVWGQSITGEPTLIYVANYNAGSYVYTYQCSTSPGSGGGLENSNGVWRNFENTLSITSETFNLSDIPDPELGYTVDNSNTVKIFISGTDLNEGDDVQIQVVKQNAAETWPTYITTLYGIANSNGQVIVDWTVFKTQLNDLELENGGTKNLYFKVFANGESKVFSNRILSLTILDDLNTPPSPTGNAAWMNYAFTSLISSISLNIANLIGGEIPVSSKNSVGLIYENNSLSQGTGVTFKIYNNENSQLIRTIQGPTINSNHQAKTTWTLNEDDLNAALGAGFSGGDSFNAYFSVETSFQGNILGTFTTKILNINLFAIEDLLGYWWDYNNQPILGQITFYEGNLGGVANSGNTVKVHAESNIPSSSAVYVDVWEEDLLSADDEIRTSNTPSGPLTGTVQNGEITFPWTVSLQDIALTSDDNNGEYKFYFKVHVDDEIKDFSNVILNLKVVNLDQPYAYWAEPVDEIQINSWVFPTEGENILAIVENSGLPEGAQDITIYDSDSVSGESGADDPIKTLTGYVDENEKLTVLWTMENADFIAAQEEEGDEYYEFYFTVDGVNTEEPILNTSYSQAIILDCENDILTCQDYLEMQLCQEDPCGVNVSSSPNCDDENITCLCEWDENAEPSCSGAQVFINPSGVDPSLIGTCSFSQNIIENSCETQGQMHIEWLANWRWNADYNTFSSNGECTSEWISRGIEGNYANTWCIEDPETEGIWHFDPPEAPGELSWSSYCSPGDDWIACPAQIQLPFGNWVNWIAALIVILMVYYLISTTRTKKKK